MSEKWKKLGETFRKKREERRITLLDASLFTNINPSKLKRIEEGDLKGLDAEVYIKSYIKRYSEFLELSPDEMLKLYEEGKEEAAEEVEEKKPRKKKEKEKTRDLVMFFFLIAGLVLLLFSVMENVKLRQTPPAYLVAPEGTIVNGKSVSGEIPLQEGEYIVESRSDVVLKTASEEWTVKIRKFEVSVSWEK